MSSHDPRVEAIFHEALERAPAEREAFVAKRRGDESLQREVQRLLIAHEDATAYFEPPNSPEIDAEFARLKPEERASGSAITSCSNRSAKAALASCGWRSRRSPFGGGWR
jgi:hypothetical protein